jgi:hypothetical protein
MADKRYVLRSAVSLFLRAGVGGAAVWAAAASQRGIIRSGIDPLTVNVYWGFLPDVSCVQVWVALKRSVFSNH